MDFSMKKAAQNFSTIKDHQLRIVRNSPHIRYISERVMHEHLVDTRTGETPKFVNQDDVGGPFHDHYHCFFRRTYPGTKEWNEANYSRLERGEPMLIR